MPAQEGEKPQPKESAPKTEAKAPMDDAATANDRAIVALDAFIGKQQVDKKSTDWRTSLTEPPLQTFDAKCDYFWHVETSVGLVKIRLLPDAAPMHVTCGIYLARLGYYDGLKFHRIITGFMAQGGCPLGTGRGGPGYTIGGEFTGGRKHDKPGLLSAANVAGNPKSDGSQFFLTFVPTSHLDGKHTIWGEVVEGMETLKALEDRGNRQGSPTPNSPTIVRTWISVANKADAQKPKDAEKPKDPEKPKDAGKQGK